MRTPVDEFERKAQLPPCREVCPNRGISLKIFPFGQRRAGVRAHRVGKARRAGFCESVDSERMFLDLFARFRAERIIP